MLRQRIRQGLALGLLGLLPAAEVRAAPPATATPAPAAKPAAAPGRVCPPTHCGIGGGCGAFNQFPGNPYAGNPYAAYYPFWGGGYRDPCLYGSSGSGGGYYYGGGYGYGGGSSVVVVQQPVVVYQPPPGYVMTPAPPGSDPAKLPPPAQLLPPPDPGVAYIDLNLPDNAELWVQGVKMTQTGTSRRFVTPTLSSGYDYSYELRIVYKENGKDVTLVRHISVRAGDRKSLMVIAQPPEIAAAK